PRTRRHAVPAGSWGRERQREDSPLRIGSAREAFGGKLGEILLKAPLLVLAELAQIGPGIEAGVVAVIEHDAGGVIADQLDAQDAHHLLAGHGDALFGAMALHLGAWAHHP